MHACQIYNVQRSHIKKTNPSRNKYVSINCMVVIIIKVCDNVQTSLAGFKLTDKQSKYLLYNVLVYCTYGLYVSDLK